MKQGGGYGQNTCSWKMVSQETWLKKLREFGPKKERNIESVSTQRKMIPCPIWTQTAVVNYLDIGIICT